MENAVGSVADTQIPSRNLMKHSTTKELVCAVTSDVMLHKRHATANKVFRFALSTSMPTKIPETALDTLKAGPDSNP